MLWLTQVSDGQRVGFRVADAHCHLGEEAGGPVTSAQELASAHQRLGTELAAALSRLPAIQRVFVPESVEYRPLPQVQAQLTGVPESRGLSSTVWAMETWLVDWAAVIPLCDGRR